MVIILQNFTSTEYIKDSCRKPKTNINGLTNGYTSMEWETVTMPPRIKACACWEPINSHDPGLGEILPDPLGTLPKPGARFLCKEPFEDHWCSVCPYFSEGETKTNKDQMLHLKSYSQILLRWNQFSDPQDSTFPHTRLLSTSKPPAGSLQQNFLSISGNQSRPGWIWATQGHLSLSASHQAMPTPGVWSLTLMVS